MFSWYKMCIYNYNFCKITKIIYVKNYIKNNALKMLKSALKLQKYPKSISLLKQCVPETHLYLEKQPSIPKKTCKYIEIRVLLMRNDKLYTHVYNLCKSYHMYVY